ncbi:alkaline phosphatase [Haloarchaeobius sp. FL176]|uniref:alkaline phosphatase D family protein n=1 Tax=Haloarchaeobius sp. FL176 TaxID=2967129 RepID=UPI002147BB56|nr:alkaline phosphatase D family protein [Haloarchaeobius sp. FL176]
MSDDGTPRHVQTNRRGFLRSVGTTAVAGGLASMLGERAIAEPVAPDDGGADSLFSVDPVADPDDTFPQSVMSGGPTAAGALVWTRVAPPAYQDGQALGVQVATDEALDDIVFEGSVPAGEIGPEHDYTVTVDLDGELDSDRFYHYRFVYGDTATRTGRLRTLPTPDESVESVSFAVITCQDYQNGYYGAYHHLANEDVDFLVHLGDFIYESADGAYVSPTEGVKPGRDLELPSGESLAESVGDFRHLYNTYKADPLLQEGLEQHTIIAGWDDHEIGNNRYWDYATESPVLPDKEGGDDPETALEITANGIQAWVEHMPMRVEYDPAAEQLHEQFQLWRQFRFGDLVDLAFTDERLYRDGPPCEDATVTCTDEEAEDRTVLGDEQQAWFESWVAGSDATWTTWANEVLNMPLTKGDGFNQVEFVHDSWDGFQYERWELLQHVKETDPQNFVTLTGDLHCAMAGYMMEGYGEIDWQWDYDRVGVELMTPSVTSVNAADVIDFPDDWDRDALTSIAMDQNEHIQYLDWHHHGYAVVEFTTEECNYTVYSVDKEENSTDATKEKLAEYRTPNGEIELEELYLE